MVLTGRLVRQQSWQEIVDESSIREGNGESFQPDSCGDFREEVAEALTGEADRPVIEPRNRDSGDVDVVKRGGRQHGARR